MPITCIRIGETQPATSMSRSEKSKLLRSEHVEVSNESQEETEEGKVERIGSADR